MLLSDKSATYLLATQLALSQFPGSAVAAAVGWLVGYAWRSEILPGAARWRVPTWFAGKEVGEGHRYEGLRRRLEGESTVAAAASGVDGRLGGNAGGEGRRQRRTLGTQILDQFRGAF